MSGSVVPFAAAPVTSFTVSSSPMAVKYNANASNKLYSPLFFTLSSKERFMSSEVFKS
uniref:Uncharacterized protein n=1 Tax=Rhizophora mucronata TaxID=61149 RepID=A0A2P2JEE6_RHIMU